MNFKIRILAVVLVVCMVIPLTYGCTQIEQSPDENTGNAKTEKLSNVYRTQNFSVPESYRVTTNNTAVYNNRIYMLCNERIPESVNYEVRWVIYSTDLNGENPESEIYTPSKDGNWVSGFRICDDGSRIFLEGEEAANTKEYYIIRNDPSGNNIFKIPVLNMFPEPTTMYDMGGSFGIRSILIDSENRIYLFSYSTIVVISSDGKKLFHISVSGMISYSLLIDEKPSAIYFETEQICRYIDAENQKFGDKIPLPDKMNTYSSMDVYPKQPSDDSEYDFYLKTEIGLNGVKDGKVTEIVNWLNCSVSAAEMYYTCVLNQDTIFFSTLSEATYGFLKRVPEDEISEKYTIKVAYQSNMGNQQITEYAAKFNQQSEKYQITFIDYSASYNSELSSEELLNFDIVSGKVPDMFLFDSHVMTGKEYEDKGLFADLYEYMDKDSEMTRDYFLKCVKTPFENNGKLFRLADGLTAFTLAGKSEIVGSKRGWSISDMLEVNENLKEGSSLFTTGSKTEMMVYVMRGMNEFIDEESGTCSFGSDTFKRYLEFIAELPMEFDMNRYYDSMYMNESTILNYVLIDSPVRLFSYKDAFGTDDVSMVGYPGAGGDGAYLRAQLYYAVSAKSSPEIRDGAWEFIKFSIRCNNNSDLGWAIPTTYTGFENMAEKEMDIYYLVSLYSLSPSDTPHSQAEISSSGGREIKLTRDDIDSFLEYFESLTGINTLDEKVEAIINEELEIFLAGAKTAEETANLIQSRVSIYISESH